MMHRVVLAMGSVLSVALMMGCGGNDNNAGSNTSGGAATGGARGSGASGSGGTSAAAGGGPLATSGGATSAGGTANASGGSACTPADGVLVCGAPLACGDFVAWGAEADTAPAPLGGTITDGVYQLVQAVAFGESSDPNPAIRMTKVISNGTIASTALSVGSAASTMSSGPYTVSGGTLAWNTTCPSAATDSYFYTATANQLILYQSAVSITMGMVYNRVQ